MNVTVYGASDDLIEVEGDVSEEFTYDDDNDNYLVFSDGTVLRVEYGSSGVWRISPVSGTPSIAQAPEDDDSNYSDRAMLDAGEQLPIRWVVHGIGFAKAQEKADV